MWPGQVPTAIEDPETREGSVGWRHAGAIMLTVGLLSGTIRKRLRFIC